MHTNWASKQVATVKRHWVRFGVGAIIVLFIEESLFHMFGQLGATLMEKTWEFLTTQRTILLLPFVLVYVVLLVGLIALLIALRNERAVKTKGVELADLSTKLSTAVVRGRTLEEICEVFINESLEIFDSDVYRNAVLCPDPMDLEYLVLWVAPFHGPRSRVTRRFYIGPNQNRKEERNIHGATFYDGKFRIARYVEHDHQPVLDVSIVTFFDDNQQAKEPELVPDRDTYKVLTPTMHTRTYKSFVSIPINDLASGTGKRWGVVLFDGQNVDSFDAPSDWEILLAISNSLAQAVYLHSIRQSVAPQPVPAATVPSINPPAQGGGTSIASSSSQ